MESRDWITIVVLIVTIISSHWLASKQTRKTKTAKWIEDFRSEISQLFALAILTDRNKVDTIINLSTKTWTIIMLLNDNNKSQMKLVDEIGQFGLFMSERFNANSMEEYKQRIQVIKNLAKAIIREEEKKL